MITDEFMAPRRYADRAELGRPFYREKPNRGRDRFAAARGSIPVDRHLEGGPSTRARSRFKSDLDRDFAAMRRVWQMLRAGAARMVGEVGRQY